MLTKMVQHLGFVVGCLLLPLSNVSLASDSGDAKGIMERVDEMQRKVSDATLTKSRLSTCKFGKKDKRLVCVEKPRLKEMETVSVQLGDEKKDSQSISIILQPASDRGIGMLTYSYDDESKDTESWLYLSALGRVKRMASGSGEDKEPVSLFGSEFTTEDMENGKVDEYTFNIVKEGAYGRHQVWVIEALPKPVRLKKTNYSKVLYWVDKERFIALKVQTYDKRGKLFKRIVSKKIEKIKGLWIARDVTLMNMKNQRLSNMKTDAIAMSVDLDDEFLTQRTLTDFAYREKELENLRKYFQ